MLPLFLLSTLFPSLSLAADICNGHAELCGRSYADVTFLGAHDSYAVGTSLAADQSSDVTTQLNDGIRTLQVQAHNESDGIHLCHTACSLLDGGTLESYLAEVNTWVQANPTEVITIVLVNSDSLPPTAYTSAFQSAGLQSSVYSPPSAQIPINSWPTLGALVDAKTTVVVIMNYNADFNSVPWIIDEFSNMFEDAYNVVDTTWSCAANRSSASPSSSLMMINHFLDESYNLAGTQFFIPDKDQINVTNSEASLTQHINNCNTLWGRKPNHILLDFYNSNGAEPFNYVATLNGVSAPTNTIAAVSVSGGTGTTPSGSSGSSQDAQVSSSQRGSSTSGAAGTRADLVGRGWGLAAGLMGLGMVSGALGMWL